MFYASFVFWSIVAIFAARAVHGLLAGVVPAKVLNYALLPGTLVAQIGHHVALLVTGGTVNASRLANESTGEPEIQADGKPRIPVLGPVLVAMVPIFLCGLALLLAANFLSAQSILRDASHLPQSLPRSLGALWDWVRAVVNALDASQTVWMRANWDLWRTWLFAYLTICLTIRMSPLSDDLRPALLGVAAFGVLAWLAGLLLPQVQLGNKLLQFWPNLSFLVSNLLLVLLIVLAGGACRKVWDIIKGPASAGGRAAGRSAGKPSAKAV